VVVSGLVKYVPIEEMRVCRRGRERGEGRGGEGRTEVTGRM
jgi:hypothetical protein